jgi:hypothetical protein
MSQPNPAGAVNLGWQQNSPVTDARESPRHTPPAGVENVVKGGSLLEPTFKAGSRNT